MFSTLKDEPIDFAEVMTQARASNHRNWKLESHPLLQTSSAKSEFRFRSTCAKLAVSASV